MWGILRDLLAVAVIAATIVALAWLTKPIGNGLLTGPSCAEITARLAAEKNHTLTPAEATDVANCSEP
jgi:hypothetical protein